MFRKTLWLLVAVCVGYGGYVIYTEYAAGLYYMAGRYDRMMNPYGIDPDAPEPTPEETAFHQSMFVADMHADTLKWERDLLERSAFGHADVPRMMEGNIALQGFTIVTKSPLRMPWSDCVSGASPDTNTLLSAMQGRPIFDLRERALYQVERFRDAAARSRETAEPELRLILSADDLETFIQDRMDGMHVIGGILGIEGGHWIGGPGQSDDDVRADMRELYDAGVRMFALGHRFDNTLAGSSEGCGGYGLTHHGRIALMEAERLGITVDLAHISPTGLEDAIDLLERPFTISHTGIQAECDDPCRPDRNLSDDDLRLIIENDGLIAVGFWPQAIGPSVWRLPEVMDHIQQITLEAGREPGRQIALGSDYDGSVTPLIEVGHLDVLTALLRRGPIPFDNETIRDISGRNVCRLFATTLPGGNEERAESMCSELAHLAPTDADIGPAEDETGPDREAAAPGAGGTGPGGTGPGGTGAGGPDGPDGGNIHRAGWIGADMIAWIARTQSDMTHRLRAHLAGVGAGGSAGAVATLLIGFVYGLAHAAGPGHGKFVVGAWYISHPGRPLRAIALSFGMSMLQAITAIAAVTLLIVVAGSTMARLFNQVEAVELLAYTLIAGLGLSMLVRALRSGHTCHACDNARDHADGPSTGYGRDVVAMAIAVGLRPCTGALILLLFTLATGAYFVGILATLAMGVGAGLTVSLSAVGAIGLRHGVRSLAASALPGTLATALAAPAAKTIQIGAALAITTIGLLFASAAFLRMGVL